MGYDYLFFIRIFNIKILLATSWKLFYERKRKHILNKNNQLSKLVVHVFIELSENDVKLKFMKKKKKNKVRKLQKHYITTYKVEIGQIMWLKNNSQPLY